MSPLLVAALALLLGGALVWLFGRRLRGGLPRGRVLYRDADGQGSLLRDPKWGLVGKPDYVLDSRDGPVPVELKPSRRGAEPYLSDQLQLAAYFALVEASFGRRPPYGYLVYANARYRIRNTPALRAQLAETLEAIRAARGPSRPARTHDQPGRCLACSYRQGCPQALIEAPRR